MPTPKKVAPATILKRQRERQRVRRASLVAAAAAAPAAAAGGGGDALLPVYHTSDEEAPSGGAAAAPDAGAALVDRLARGSLQGDRFRHATTFLRWRDDKPPADCRYDQLEVATPFELSQVLRAGKP